MAVNGQQFRSFPLNPRNTDDALNMAEIGEVGNETLQSDASRESRGEDTAANDGDRGCG